MGVSYMVDIKIPKGVPSATQKAKFKKVLRNPKQIVLKIKDKEEAEYVNRYFKDEWEEAKRRLFFK